MSEWVNDTPLLWRMGAALVLLAALVGPLGCFVVWRRMAYFGDALAHSALIGIAIGAALHIYPSWTVFGVGAAFAWGVSQLRRSTHLSNDALLGVLMHASLGVGLLALGSHADEHELHELLFGDIAQITGAQVLALVVGVVLTLGLIAWQWQQLVLLSLDESIAQGEGVRAEWRTHLLNMLMALAVALALQLTGILLVTAMLIIPASAARLLARTPETMAILASTIALVAGLGGTALAGTFALPIAATITSVATALFFAAFMLRQAR